ncbi:hypothetical protein BCT27_14895 [Enterovibrio norvegicus]|nr:hypothetical protein BCT27_14895 [Enterovibrio norvegicus]
MGLNTLLNFVGHRINQRKLKKRFRRLEADLGNTLKQQGANISNSEFMSNLDFWVSYYVTCLLRKTELPSDFWCDGSTWNNERHSLEFYELSKYQYSLKCELDIQDEKSCYCGTLLADIEFDQKFKKVISYKILLSVEDNEYLFSSMVK